MPKRKRRRKYVDGDGVEYEFDPIEIDLRKGTLESLLEDALGADEDDRIIKEKSKIVSKYISRTTRSKDTLKRWYELGKLLQFVDNLNLRDDSSKREAFQRLFKDLEVDSVRNPSVAKIARYPEHMYRLAKLPRELVFYKGMTWSRWFDILEYKSIYQNHKVLGSIVRSCCNNNWSAKVLRAELQKQNKEIKGVNEECK